MATNYTRHTWAAGDQPTAEQFNEMEAGIEEAANNRLPLDGGTLTGAVSASGIAVGTHAIRSIYATTTDLTAGTTALPTGEIALVYE